MGVSLATREWQAGAQQRARRFFGYTPVAKEMDDTIEPGSALSQMHPSASDSAPDTARMLEVLEEAGIPIGASTGPKRKTNTVVRPHERRAPTAAQLAADEACARVLADRRKIRFAPEFCMPINRPAAGVVMFSIDFKYFGMGDFMVDRLCPRAGCTWHAPHHGATAPPWSEPVAYTQSREGLWASSHVSAGITSQGHSTSVLCRPRSASSANTRRSRASKAAAQPCPVCSRPGKVVRCVPCRDRLYRPAVAALADDTNSNPYLLTHRVELKKTERSVQIPGPCRMTAVLDMKPPGCARLKPPSAAEPASGLLGRCSSAHKNTNGAGVASGQRTRRGKLVWAFPFLTAKGNRAKLEIEICSIVAARRAGHTLTLELNRPGTGFVGNWHHGEAATWTLYDFTAGECAVALEHTVTARRTVEMDQFCQMLTSLTSVNIFHI